MSLFFQSFVAKSSCYDFICTSIINVVIGLFFQSSHVHLLLLQHLFAICHLHQQCFHSRHFFIWIPLHLLLGKHFMQEVPNIYLFTLVLPILLLICFITIHIKAHLPLPHLLVMSSFILSSKGFHCVKHHITSKESCLCKIFNFWSEHKICWSYSISKLHLILLNL